MRRCANNVLGYCKEAPIWKKRPVMVGREPKGREIDMRYPTEGTCKLDPKTCEKHQTLTESIKEV